MAKNTKAGKPSGTLKPTQSGSYIDHEPITPQSSETETATAVQAAEVVVLNLEDRAKAEVERFGKADKGIANLQKKYGKLAIKDVDDKEGYKKVHAAWQEVRAARIAFETTHKTVKADYLYISKAIDGEKNRLVGKITPLEDQLYNEWKRIDNEKEAAKKKLELEAQQKLQSRVAELIGAGITFDGTFYTIADISVDVLTLQGLEDDRYKDLLGRVEIEAGKIKEAERLQKEQQEKDAKELEELRQQKANQRESLRNSRTEVLETLGFRYSYRTRAWEYTNDTGTESILSEDLADLEDGKWAEMVKSAKEYKTRLDEKQAEADKKAQERRDLQMSRLAKLQPFMLATTNCGVETICDLSEADFEKLFNEVKTHFEEMKRLDVRSFDLWKRFQMLEKEAGDAATGYAAGFFRKSKYDGVPNMFVSRGQAMQSDDSKWLALIAELTADYKKIIHAESTQQELEEKAAEELRQSMLTEKEKVIEWLEKLNAITSPVVNTTILRLCVDNVREMIGKHLASTHQLEVYDART